jgi:hypothetical protein
MSKPLPIAARVEGALLIPGFGQVAKRDESACRACSQVAGVEARARK